MGAGAAEEAVAGGCDEVDDDAAAALEEDCRRARSCSASASLMEAADSGAADVLERTPLRERASGRLARLRDSGMSEDVC